MKVASPATIAILAAGQFKRLDLYSITLSGGSPTYYFTTHQLPVIVGGQLYQTGLTLTRGATKQSVGMSVQTMQLTATPQGDNSSGAVIIGGFPFLTACAQRVLDGARILFSKMFLLDYDDLSPGAVGWFQGRVNTIVVDRFSAVITINSDVEMLNTQAPLNVLQPGCTHTLFDPGCGLNAAAFAINGSIVAGSTVLAANTNLSQPDKYFSLGKIQFLTGVNVGVTRFVKFYGSSVMSFARPLPNAPNAGDTFTAWPGCPKTIAACSNADPTVGPPLNNLRRNRSEPFVPVPETLYDGGTTQVGSTTIGHQGGAPVGSPFSSGVGLKGSYKP